MSRALSLCTLAVAACAITACADTTPTAATLPASPDLVSITALPRVTLDYVCARTFKVTSRPYAPVLLYSHTNRGVAFYQPAASFTSYVDGQITAEGNQAWVDVGFQEPRNGLAAADTAAITACATSDREPSAASFTLSHVCWDTWYIENRNPVAYRFTWGIVPQIGNMFVINVPAATAEGPARLFFGTRAEKWRTITLGFGDREIARVTPTSDTFERCRVDDPL